MLKNQICVISNHVVNKYYKGKSDYIINHYRDKENGNDRFIWTNSNNNIEYDSLWTILNNEENITWQEFIEYDEVNEKNYVGSRIVRMKYEGFNINGQDIDTIPPSIKRVDSLKFLYLSNNNLKNIPTEIGNLERLKILHWIEIKLIIYLSQ